MNYWKVAFFILLFANLTLDAVLLVLFVSSGHTILNTGVALTHLRESYTDCEAHRDLLHRLAEQQIREPTGGAPTLKVLKVIDLRYDGQGRYLGSNYGGSYTPGFGSLPPPP
jgi:uncharacterized protein YpmS